MSNDSSLFTTFFYPVPLNLPTLNENGDLCRFDLPCNLPTPTGGWVAGNNPTQNSTLSNLSELLIGAIACASQEWLDDAMIGFGDQVWEEDVPLTGNGGWRLPVVVYTIN